MKNFVNKLIRLTGYLVMNFVSYVVFPFIILFIIFGIGYTIFSAVKRKDIRTEGKIVCGKVISTDRKYKGDYAVDIVYVIDSSSYSETIIYSKDERSKININDCLKVYYLADDPHNPFIPKDSINRCDCN